MERNVIKNFVEHMGEYIKVEDFCFEKNILEKVTILKIKDVPAFLRDHSKDETERQVISHPNIESIHESLVFRLKGVESIPVFKAENQCK